MRHALYIYRSKFLLAALMFVCSMFTIQAQTFGKLWKEVAAAEKNDLPKTAIKAVDKIRFKAMAEKNDVQLLRAALVRLYLSNDIAPDSAEVELRRLRTALDRTKEPVMLALYQSAVGQLYFARQHINDSLYSAGEALLNASLQHMELLSRTPAEKYLPLFVAGKDSRIYGNDLLHVLAQTWFNNISWKIEHTEMRQRLIDCYEKQQRHEAVLMLRLDNLKEGRHWHWGELATDSTFQAYRNLASTYEKLPLNVRTYSEMVEYPDWSELTDEERTQLIGIAEKGVSLYGKEKGSHELKNWLSLMRMNRLILQSVPNTMQPGSKTKVAIKSKGIFSGELRLYRLGINSAEELPSDEKEQEKLPRTLWRTFSFNLKTLPDYLEQTDSLQFSIGEPGIYVAALYDGKKEVDSDIIHCTQWQSLRFKMPDGNLRIALVDSRSGNPVKKFSVTELRHEGSTYEERKVPHRYVHPSNEQGFVIIKQGDRSTCYAYTETDKALPAFEGTSYYGYNENDEKEKLKVHLRLFTDRGIYRPGQTVYFNGIAYTQLADSTRAINNRLFNLILRNSNGKEVERLSCLTDEKGNLSGQFKLPQSCLPGTFRISTDGAGGFFTHNFEVQEYKRPTFTVEPDRYYSACMPGDTAVVSGRALTYTELPVEGARVHYTVKVHQYRYFYSPYVQDDKPAYAEGNTVTDADGRFSISIPTQHNNKGIVRASYTVNFEVTAPNGETQSGSAVVYSARQRFILYTEAGKTFCRDEEYSIKPRFTNAAGEDIAAKVRVFFTDGKQLYADTVAEANKTLKLLPEQLPPSGRYKLIALTDTLTDTTSVTCFGLKDTKPMFDQVLWNYFHEIKGTDSTDILIGTTEKDATLFYDIYTSKELVESKVISLSDTLLHFPFAYRPEYGDGATIKFALARNGNLYLASRSVTRPEPDKRLKLSWTTFRSTLTPGQKEEWRLRITYPDGSPADASIMARLYDASLDALKKYYWSFWLQFDRSLGQTWWQLQNFGKFVLSGKYDYDYLYPKPFNFTHWDEQLFATNFFYRNARYRLMSAGGATPEPMLASVATEEKMMMKKDAAADLGDKAEDAPTENVKKESGNVRTNFAETAFFMPRLLTDKNGSVSLSFTLPESLTKWNFTALAHTADMDWGIMNDEIVARKEFMVQPNLPRFVREGDEAQTAVSVRNLTDHALKGEVVCRIIDPRTDRTVSTTKHKFNAPAEGATTIVITLPTETLRGMGVAICRIEGKAAGFSDGEEHYLPILSDREEVVNTLPFSLKKTGTTTLRIDTLWYNNNATDRRLTVEVSSNPLWYVVSALPQLAARECYSITSWAERLYTLQLARRIAQTVPQLREGIEKDANPSKWGAVLGRNEALKQTLMAETPWLAEAEDEADRAVAMKELFDESNLLLRKQTALDRLRDNQLSDGSWSWFPGMKGSLWITLDVVKTFARMKSLTGYTDADAMFSKALRFLEKEVAEYVTYCKRNKIESGCNSLWMDYLYARALTDSRASGSTQRDIDFLLKGIKKDVAGANMELKAQAAVVLAYYGEEATSRIALQSLMEHTVVTDEMGRYFDTRRAPSSWSSYRLPTQTATIEAMLKLNGDAEQIAEMRLWLLQSKRTQIWKTSQASADAIYALLCGGGMAFQSLSQRPVDYALEAQSKYVAVSAPSKAEGATGYYLDTYSDKATLAADHLRLTKKDEGLSWGSVFANFTLPISEVVGKGKGLHVSRRMEVLRSGKWLPVEQSTTIGVGERLRAVFTLKAERDFDYVMLRMGRAACLEPTRPLSGYTFTNAGPCYRVVRDADTQFYIERLAKGTHTLTEEMRTDRAGTYHLAPARLQSLYAPEYVGITQSDVLRVD